MRPFILYLAVALSAFGIGSFFVYTFYFKNSEPSVIAQTTEVTTSENKEPTLNIIQEAAADEESDEEYMAFEVLKPAIEKWLRNMKIKREFTDASDESIKQILGKEKSELSEGDIGFLRGFRYEPTLIDVDNNGKSELAIRNSCGGVGNCKFWILKKKGKSYEIILQSEPGAVQMFKLRNTKTNNYLDIETTAHSDAWSGEMNVYKFDGKEYKISECYNYNYSYLKNGKLYELKKPLITPRKCND